MAILRAFDSCEGWEWEVLSLSILSNALRLRLRGLRQSGMIIFAFYGMSELV